MSINIKTTILHCKSLKDRKQNMLQQMCKHHFSDYCFYEDFDGNELTNETITQHCKRKANDWSYVKTKLEIYQNLHPQVMTTQRELTNGEISLAIKHGKIYKELSRINAEYFIIFEDDVILCENFETHFNDYLSRTPSDWDVIYFGRGCNLHPQNITKENIAYKMNHPASRCSDSMLLKKSAVEDLAKTWFPFHLAADWELGYQHFFHNHNIYWWEPSLVVQGSVCGLYGSSLR